MILVLDNYDSFTYNLVQFLGEIIDNTPSLDGTDIEVIRNDQVTVEAIAERRHYSRLVVSPGPCTPNEAGISCALIERMAGTLPILGVCLGHQSIGQVFGGKIIRAPMIIHGKTSQIHHTGHSIFTGLENPMEATRYHSLIIERETIPDCLDIIAWSDDGVIMGVKHKELPVWGVQFHPESILTNQSYDGTVHDQGKKLLKNFLCEETGT